MLHFLFDMMTFEILGDIYMYMYITLKNSYHQPFVERFFSL